MFEKPGEEIGIIGILGELATSLKDLVKDGATFQPGHVKVYNFSVVNSEKVFRLHGYAQYLNIHNSGASDIALTFPDSGGKCYTIPSGNNNANPLIIPNIKKHEVDKLILRSNGVASTAEVVAVLWEE